MSSNGQDQHQSAWHAKCLLGDIIETRLACAAPAPEVFVPSPWDAWWACYRAGIPLGDIGTTIRFTASACPSCTARALRLVSADPPARPVHPYDRQPDDCGCLTRWATAFRAPAPAASWPAVSLSLALIKPDAPAAQIAAWLGGEFDVLDDRSLTLTAEDTRHMYPDAYGEDYIEAVNAYLTSGPVRILLLHGKAGNPGAAPVKARIRGRLGGDATRNHLHMPDNPGETLADIALFAGHDKLAELYRRYEGERTARRLAFYRAALGISPAGADRRRSAG